ncbi:tetratricopeptide repeat protein [Jiella sp. MQZ9-1]|uniref:Glycosyltransferase n=1 Tax=Jiella flava TaxID=2816857 RepID=A0A939FZY5_9HYPH|nr:tetratricopeptide repeat protein [Jiella flava]MBO0662489.1 glycosyltransferase [Jiella flava]MCD2471714.1 tetratricopeptide repeat protein [Jiella flava]
MSLEALIGWFAAQDGIDPARYSWRNLVRDPGGVRTRDLAAAKRWWWRQALVRRADVRRKRGRVADAAIAYRAALALAPWSTRLKILCGNLLRDAGQFEASLVHYRSALDDNPKSARAYLHLGHTLKLMGERSAAIDAYRKAFALEPGHEQAAWELVQAGEQREQGMDFVAQMKNSGVETLLKMSVDVAEMRTRLAEISSHLPDLATLRSFPVQAYGTFRRVHQLPVPTPMDTPLPSVLILARAAGLDPDALHRLLASIVTQTVGTWRTVILDADPDGQKAVARIMRAEPRLQFAGRESGETASALEYRLAHAASESAVLFLRDHAILDRSCVAWVATVMTAGDAAVVTCDEEWLSPGAGEPIAFAARGRFDRDMLLQANVWGASMAVRTAAFRSLDLSSAEDDIAFARSDLLFASTRAALRIAHLPLPLIASVPRDHESDDVGSGAASQGHERAVERHLSLAMPGCRLATKGTDGKRPLRLVWPAPKEADTITVIVPTRNNADDCTAMVKSLFDRAGKPDAVACLVVDNGTDRPADRDQLTALSARQNVSVWRDEGAFNWSHLNNVAAEQAKSPLLLFANDDMEMLTGGWDEMLRGHLARPEVGALGAKLLYHDDTIQHAGVIFGWKGSVIHDGLYEPSKAPGPLGRWQMTRQVSAVTGAFMAVRKADFEAVGGFDAVGLPVGYSDVDLCLKLQAKGLAVLWTPDISLYHAESKSRGFDHLDLERAARSMSERRTIEARWGRERFCADPTVNPIWVDATLPFRLIAAVDAEQALAFAKLR